MEQIFKDFGVQPILLAAQVVNFLILMFLLKRFLYKPILNVLETRKSKIAQSLKDADEIEKRLQKISSEQEKRINEAMNEARKIIEDANKSSEDIVKDAQLKASQEATKIIEKAKIELRSERDQLKTEIRNEVGDLVALSLKRFFSKDLSDKDKKDLVESSLKNLS